MDNKRNKKTNTTAEFSAQYRSPLWQKKRLEVLEHDEYRCILCGNKDAELHVHHASYIKGRKIWEYEKEDLITVCETCHHRLHESKDRINEIYLPLLQRNHRNGDANNLVYSTCVLEILLEIVCGVNTCETAKDALQLALKCHYENKIINGTMELVK